MSTTNALLPDGLTFSLEFPPTDSNEPHYAVEEDGNIDGLISRATTRLHHQQWLKHFRNLNQLGDIRPQATILAKRSGISEYYISNYFEALSTLDYLPLFNAWWQKTYALDLGAIIAIDKALHSLSPADLPLADELLIDAFTPRIRGQRLPSRSKIAEKVHRIVREIDSSLEPDPSEDDVPLDTLPTDPGDVTPGNAGPDDVTPGGGEEDGVAKDPSEEEPSVPRPAIRDLSVWMTASTASVEFTIDRDRWAEIELRIKALQRESGQRGAKHGEPALSEADAFYALLRGEGPRVALNLFQASDAPANAPAFVESIGWVHPAYAADLARRAGVIRDADQNLQNISQSYTCPETLAAAIRGRDGTCRYPGCTVPAERCDLDHRINFADGGPSTAGNLACLCRQHHNLKTDGTIFYVMDPITGEITWLFEDGTYLTDAPSGPLSEDGRRWVRTFSSRRKARRERKRQEAQDRKIKAMEREELLEEKRKQEQANQPPPPF